MTALTAAERAIWRGTFCQVVTAAGLGERPDDVDGEREGLSAALRAAWYAVEAARAVRMLLAVSADGERVLVRVPDPALAMARDALGDER